MKIEIKSTMSVVLSVLSLGACAAESQWAERWVHGYVGKSGNSTVPSSEDGVEGMYEFSNQVFLTGLYHVSKETSGGTDNNALYSYSTVIAGGYSFNVRPDTKVQIGYAYQDADVKNVQMGGIRVGAYRDQHVYGNGPMMRVVHKVTQSLSADVMLLQLKYTSDVTNMNSRIGLSYDFASNLYGRVEINSIDRSGYSSNRWALGVGYRF